MPRRNYNRSRPRGYRGASDQWIERVRYELDLLVQQRRDRRPR